METEFIEGDFPAGYSYDFDPYIFNLPENIRLQAKQNWISFFAVRAEKKLVRAQVHFYCEGSVAMSPRRNPFGSIEFTDAFSPKELFDFIQFIESALLKRNLRRIEITGYPQLYHPSRFALLSTLLINRGFSVGKAEVSASIKVSPTALFDSLSSWEKRKLRQQKETELRFNVFALDQLDKIFGFIEDCRRERRQSLSMTLEQLRQAVKVFPDRYYLFAMCDNEKLAAASIAIRINKTILYNFYSAHATSYDKVSPVVGSIEGMYNFCQQESIDLLDLGTSALDGKPNFPLLDFKLNLGAQPSSKLSFAKSI